MPVLLPILAMLAAGVALAVQGPTNAALARVSGSVIQAALFSFGVGTLVLVAAWIAFDRTPAAALRGAPAWTLVGGLYGAGFVAAMAYAAPRLGIAAALTVAIASQLATALVLDHYGWLGLREAPVTPGRLAGAALVLVGAVLVRRG